MRWLSLLASSLLCVGSLAAKAPTNTFQTFHARQLASTPIKLDDKAYQQLVRTPRDHSAAILLTALDARYGCMLCRDFQPEFDLLSRSWTKGDKAGESRMIFATLDFSDGRDTFVSVWIPRSVRSC